MLSSPQRKTKSGSAAASHRNFHLHFHSKPHASRSRLRDESQVLRLACRKAYGSRSHACSPCEKIKICKRSPSFACSWSVSAPWATFFMPFRPSPRCASPIPSGRLSGWLSRRGARCSRRKEAPAATPANAAAMQPLVDRLHIAASKQWRKHPLRGQTRSEISAPSSRSQTDHYDAVLDLQGALRSAVIARMASSRRFIGESNPREWFARWLFTERIETHAPHVIEQDIELASAVAGDDSHSRSTVAAF